MKEKISLEELTTILHEMEESFSDTTELDKKVLKAFKQSMIHGYTKYNINNIYVLIRGIMDVISTLFDNNIVGDILKVVTVEFIEKAQNHGYFKELEA